MFFMPWYYAYFPYFPYDTKLVLAGALLILALVIIGMACWHKMSPLSWTIATLFFTPIITLPWFLIVRHRELCEKARHTEHLTVIREILDELKLYK